MRNATLWIVCVLTAFLLGATTTSHVWIQYSRAYEDAVDIDYIQEQLALSNRAGLRGDHVGAAIHARNAGDAENSIGFAWLKRRQNRPYWQRLTMPWRTADSHQFVISARKAPELLNGKRIVGALYYARSAIEFERSACTMLADSEWESAISRDTSWSSESKRRGERVGSPDRSPGRIELDSALLESATDDELLRALRGAPPSADAGNQSMRSTSF